jgi:DNA repair ATPase RecN
MSLSDCEAAKLEKDMSTSREAVLKKAANLSSQRKAAAARLKRP